jgi:hypothetical protein
MAKPPSPLVSVGMSTMPVARVQRKATSLPLPRMASPMTTLPSFETLPFTEGPA